MAHPHGTAAWIRPERWAALKDLQAQYRDRAAVHIPSDAQIEWQNPEATTLAAVKEYAQELADDGDRGWIAPIGDELLFILENGYRE